MSDAAVARPPAEWSDGKARLSKFVNPLQNWNLKASFCDTRGRARPTGPRIASLIASVNRSASAQWRPTSAVVGECAIRPTPYATMLALAGGVQSTVLGLLAAWLRVARP